VSASGIVSLGLFGSAGTWARAPVASMTVAPTTARNGKRPIASSCGSIFEDSGADEPGYRTMVYCIPIEKKALPRTHRLPGGAAGERGDDSWGLPVGAGLARSRGGAGSRHLVGCVERQR